MKTSQSPTGQGSTPIAEDIFYFEPGDLVSSTGATPIRAYVSGSDQRLLTELAEELELRKYPELTTVPAKLSFFIPPANATARERPPMPEKGKPIASPLPMDPATVLSFVEFQPTSSLSDGWYVLSAKHVPSGLRPLTPSPTTFGAHASRFNPGSAPTLRHVSLCEKANASFRTVFEFSESVTATANLHTLVGLRQPGVICTKVEGNSEAAEFVASVTLDCKGIVTSANLGLFVSSGIVSPTGKALRGFDGEATLEKQTRFDDLYEGGSGCRGWKP